MLEYAPVHLAYRVTMLYFIDIYPMYSFYLFKKKSGETSWKFLDCHNMQTCTTSPKMPSSAAGFCLYTTCPYIFIFYHLCFSVPSLCLDELNNIMNCYYPWYSVWYNNPAAQAYGLKARGCNMQSGIWQATMSDTGMYSMFVLENFWRMHFSRSVSTGI